LKDLKLERYRVWKIFIFPTHVMIEKNEKAIDALAWLI